MDRANEAAEEVRKRSGNGNVIVKQLDLASLQSVRQLADDVIATEERLDVLINNAGKPTNDTTMCSSIFQKVLQRTYGLDFNDLVFFDLEVS